MILDAYTHYAGFWRRFGAWLVDAGLFGTVGATVLYGLYGEAYFEPVPPGHGTPGAYTAAEVAVYHVLPFIAVVIFWVKLHGTPGKLLLGCNVVDARTGGAIGYRQAVIRCLAYIVSALPLGLGFLWIVWDERKRGFHDRLAGTLVIVEDEAAKTLDELASSLR